MVSAGHDMLSRHTDGSILTLKYRGQDHTAPRPSYDSISDVVPEIAWSFKCIGDHLRRSDQPISAFILQCSRVFYSVHRLHHKRFAFVLPVA